MRLRDLKRTVALAVAVVLAAGACGSPSTSTPSANPLNLITPGKLIVGYSPYKGLIDVVNGEPVGVYGIMIKETATRLGLQVVYQPYDFPALIPAMQANRFDVLVAGFSITQARARILYYSQPHMMGPEVLSVRPGETIGSWEEAKAKGLTLAVVQGFYEIGTWDQLGIKYHTFDNNDSCYMDVINGGAFGCAVGTFDGLLRQATDPTNPIAKLDTMVLSGPLNQADLNAFAVSHDKPALSNAIRQVMTDLWRDGVVEKAFATVFGNDKYGEFFMTPPVGQALYIPGPWEDGVTPPASEKYPAVTPVVSGKLTVGILGDTPLLSLKDGNLAGPEATVLKFAADKLGLTLTGTKIDDATAALNDKKVDLVAGELAATQDRVNHFWMTTPVGFSPDYMYVKPGTDGAYPGYKSWEDVKAAGGKIAVVSGDPRKGDIASVADVLEVSDAAAGLKAVVDGSALAFVGSTVDYVSAASADPAIVSAGIGWVRNNNAFTAGAAVRVGREGEQPHDDRCDEPGDRGGLAAESHQPGLPPGIQRGEHHCPRCAGAHRDRDELRCFQRLPVQGDPAAGPVAGATRIRQVAP
jgi:ABC-type amino acid transport substrate-binding protein